MYRFSSTYRGQQRLFCRRTRKRTHVKVSYIYNVKSAMPLIMMSPCGPPHREIRHFTGISHPTRSASSYSLHPLPTCRHPMESHLDRNTAAGTDRPRPRCSISPHPPMVCCVGGPTYRCGVGKYNPDYPAAIIRKRIIRSESAAHVMRPHRSLSTSRGLGPDEKRAACVSNELMFRFSSEVRGQRCRWPHQCLPRCFST